MDDRKKYFLQFMFILGSVVPLSIGIFLIANGITNLRTSEITAQLSNVAQQIHELEETISHLDVKKFSDLFVSMNDSLAILSSNINGISVTKDFPGIK